MSHKMLLAGAAAALLSVAAMPAFAGNEDISKGVWYTASFGTANPSFVFGGSEWGTGTHPTAVVTTPGSSSWTVTLTGPESLTVVDLEESGDQFAVFDNGVALGDTSAPNVNAAFVGGCITCAIANPDFSRGVFFLGAGVNDITIQYIGSLGDGDVAFFVGAPNGATPEPATWALMLTGFAGLGGVLRSRRKALASPA